MDFTLSEEEQLLADSVNRLIEKDYGFERRMAITRTDEGYSPEVWGAIAEMGLLGLPLAEADGGFGAGTMGMISVMAAMGTGLVVEPYVSTLICARLVAAGGADPVRGEVLEAVVGGECKLALAHGERDSRYRLSSVTTSAKRAGDDWVLDGEKSLVVHARWRTACWSAPGRPGARTTGRNLVVPGRRPGQGPADEDPAHGRQLARGRSQPVGREGVRFVPNRQAQAPPMRCSTRRPTSVHCSTVPRPLA
ncbi:MAG: acyl-CoA dehydrogenase family protein [Burkholderiaceae bacterium]